MNNELDKGVNSEAIAIFKYVADENRATIFNILGNETSPVRFTELRNGLNATLGGNIPQSTVSHHLHEMMGAGIIEKAKKEYVLTEEGREIYLLLVEASSRIREIMVRRQIAGTFESLIAQYSENLDPEQKGQLIARLEQTLREFTSQP